MQIHNFDNNLLRYSNKFNKSNIQWCDFIKTSHFSNMPLSAKSIDNAIVVSDAPLDSCFKGCVMNDNSDVIEKSLARYLPIDKDSLIKDRDLSNITYYDVEAIYLGQIRNHWGSFLLDTMARAWFHLEHSKENLYVLSLTMPSVGRDFHENIWRFFELLGIDKNHIIIIDNAARFRKLFIPDLSFLLHHYYTKEYLEIFDYILENNQIPKSDFKRIYFSRYNFSSYNKTDYGEESIIDFMKDNGFKIIYPENHDLLEQISFINGCDVFASVGGSLAHNIIFLGSKSEKKPIMFLFNRLGDYQWHQWMLNESVGVPINYIDCYIEPYRLIYKTPVNGPFLFGVNKNVKRFAKDYDWIIPKKKVGKRFVIFQKYTARIIRSILSKIKRRLVKK